MDRVGGYIDALAEKLNVASAALWEILIRQMYVDGFLNLASMVIFGVVGLVSYKYFKKGLGMKSTNNYDMDAKAATIIFSVVGMIVAFVIVILCGINGVQYIANPEYWAIQALIEAVR
jgi:chromate transport protein ChrA